MPGSEQEHRTGRETTKPRRSCGTLELAEMSWQRPQRRRGGGPRSRIRPLLGSERREKREHMAAGGAEDREAGFGDERRWGAGDNAMERPRSTLVMVGVMFSDRRLDVNFESLSHVQNPNRVARGR